MRMSILILDRVKKSYFGNVVFSDLSFQLDRGERLALIGRNGCGKTTLFRLIAGLEEPDHDGGKASLARGTVLGYLQQEIATEDVERSALADPEITQIRERLRQVELAMVETPHDENLLKQYSALTARFESLGGWDFQHRMMAALSGLGLPPDALDRPLSSFSGGERMRVALASILIRRPDLLLLDEPTNHLDIEATEWLEEFLCSYKGSVIVISHDRRFLDNVATLTGEIREGKFTLRRGNYSQFKRIEAEEHYQIEKEAKKLSLALKHEREVAQTMLSHRKMASYHSREKKVQKLSEALQTVKNKAFQSRHPFKLKIQADENRGDPNRVLIRCRDMSIQFPDADEPLFQPFDLILKGQERLCICGPNGCGKSNLIRALSAQNPHLYGELILSSGIRSAYLDQWVRFDHPHANILDTLLAANPELNPGQAQEELASYGFFSLDLVKTVDMLSGGEKARLSLCCLLQENPDIIFMDEPTNHLDIESREILEKAIQNYGGTVLAVSHDRYFVDAISEKVLGFVGDSIKLFPHYDAYRRALKQNENLERNKDEEKSAKQINSNEEVKEDKKEEFPFLWTTDELSLLPRLKEIPRRSLNKAQERRFRALATEIISQIEEKISQSEDKASELESQFQEADSGKLYEDYADIQDEINRLYELYEKLACELDS